MRSPPRSARASGGDAALLGRVAVAYAVAFALSISALAGLAYWLAERHARGQLQAEVEADLRGLSGAEALGLNELIDAVLEGAAPRGAGGGRAPPPPGRLWLLVGPDGACPLARGPRAVLCPTGSPGLAWPAEASAAQGWIRFDASFGEAWRPALGRIAELPRTGHRLLVARDLAPVAALRAAIGPPLAAAVAIALLSALAAGLLTARHLMARIERVNAFCRSLGHTDQTLAPRLPVQGGDAFAELARNLNEMLDRIEVLMRVATEFSHHAAHDLRTPLTRLRLRLEAALRVQRDAPAAEAVADAIEEADRLLDTFARLLEIARIEAGEGGDEKEVDLAAAARDAAALLADTAEERGVRLRLALAPARLARGSPAQLRVLAANLLDNALKFAPRGSTVTILTGTGPEGGARLEVADHGPGIPPEDRERALRPFVRVGRGPQPSGSGLGLALVRAVALRHGLSLELADNAPGLRVRLDAPCAASPPRSIEAEAQMPRSPRRAAA